MKVLLINSPRYYWPFVAEQDNYLCPQAYACLAASLRQNDIDVRVIDCLPEQIGWKSLERIIREEKPQIIGVGENHAMHARVAGQVIHLAKEIDPAIKTVVGGGHMTNLYHQSLQQYPIDFLVNGEGEETLVELCQELEKSNPNFHNIKGLTFKEGEKIHITQPRPLVEDLDTLPLPAYDLMPMHLYGKARYLFSPGGTTIHHSRGCASKCKFCVFWTQMAEREVTEDGKFKLKPRWRTKSVGRVMEEIEWLYKDYGKRCLVFVDDTWNLDPKWNEEFADEMIRRKLPVVWFAFVRGDLILRDEKLGIFDKMVKAGLTHICIGVERASNEDLAAFNKRFYREDKTRHVFELLHKKYPSVFLQATFIIGQKNETAETLRAQLEYAKTLKADYPAFHPLTPVPGTELWEEAQEKGWLEVTDFDAYDWMTPVMSSDTISREEMETMLLKMNQEFVSLGWFLRGVLTRNTYRRRMYVWWFIVMMRVLVGSIRQAVLPVRGTVFTQMVKPEWYDN